MVSGLDAVTSSPWTAVVLAALNVCQTVLLAHISSRSTQRRRERRQKPPAGRKGSSR